jgi:hypothetical protein
LSTSDIWAAKQQQHDSNAAWRGNIDDRGDYRFSNTDVRKPTQQFIDAPRTNQYLGNASSLMQNAARNFNHNNSRW